MCERDTDGDEENDTDGFVYEGKKKKVIEINPGDQVASRLACQAAIFKTPPGK